MRHRTHLNRVFEKSKNIKLITFEKSDFPYTSIKPFSHIFKHVATNISRCFTNCFRINFLEFCFKKSLRFRVYLFKNKSNFLIVCKNIIMQHLACVVMLRCFEICKKHQRQAYHENRNKVSSSSIPPNSPNCVNRKRFKIVLNSIPREKQTGSNTLKWNKWLIPFLNHSFLISYVFRSVSISFPRTFSRALC